MIPRPWHRISVLVLLVAATWCALPSASSSAATWVAPLPEPLTVTRAFDPPDSPYGAGHRGVDLAASPGQEVRVAGAGTVIYAGPLAGRGVISVAHADGLRTTYEPVQAAVAAGVQVSLGQVIGTVQAGHAGCPVVACLHWGLKRGEVYLDPLLLLTQGPVRLLPRYGAARSATGLEPAQLLPAAPVALSVLGLGLGLLPLAGRRHCTRPARKPGNATGATRTKHRSCWLGAAEWPHWPPVRMPPVRIQPNHSNTPVLHANPVTRRVQRVRNARLGCDTCRAGLGGRDLRRGGAPAGRPP